MKNIWFTRKLYGWGWQPSTWQGWLITLLYITFVIAHGLSIEYYLTHLAYGLVVWYSILVVLIVSLVTICYLFGETPRWQWGHKNRKNFKE